MSDLNTDFNTDGYHEWWNEAKKLYDGDSGLCALRAWQHQQKRIKELETDNEKLSRLAMKHCDIHHHDWKEVARLTNHITIRRTK